MGAPQWIFLFLSALTLVHKISEHGKPREPYSGVSGFLDFALVNGIIYWGGFYG